MFEWRLRYQIAMPGPDALHAPPVSEAVQSQRGLKLDPRNSPFEVLVIAPWHRRRRIERCESDVRQAPEVLRHRWWWLSSSMRIQLATREPS